jgi:cobalt/nickel transport system permease protein
MVKAYHLRSVKPKGIQMKDMGSFVGQLLLRSISKAERVYQAMKLRGFDGVYTIGKAKEMDFKSACYMTAVSLLVILVRFVLAGDIFRFMR